MLKSTTEMIDCVKTQAANPPAKQLGNSKEQILWLVLALFTAVLCWGLLRQTKSRKRKPKAALW